MGHFQKYIEPISPLDKLVISRDPKNPFIAEDDGEFVEVSTLSEVAKKMSEEPDGSTIDTGDVSG